jgi:GntR family transcriptional regulator
MQPSSRSSADYRPIEVEVDRDAPVPLYHQVYAGIEQQIRDGVLKPGDRIQQERELASALGVSLAPVRQAILSLVRDGYLERARGRGTFVRESAVKDELSVLSSFSSLLNATGRPWTMQLLFAGVVAPDRAVLDALDTKGRAVRIRRLAVLAEEPVALLDAYLDAARFSGVTEPGFEGSLYGRLRADFGVRMSSAQNEIGIATLTAEEAGLLGRRPKSPALEVISITNDQHDRPTEYSRVLYHPTRFTFRIDGHRHEKGRRAAASLEHSLDRGPHGRPRYHDRHEEQLKSSSAS